MKTFGRFLNSGLLLGVALLMLGCAQRVVLRNAPDVPAAVGEANITRDQIKTRSSICKFNTWLLRRI